MLEVTDVRIRLIASDPAPSGSGHLRASADIVLDDALIIWGAKIIEAARGPFLAFPDRELTDHCERCAARTSLLARYCAQCGRRLAATRAVDEDGPRSRFHAAIVHPIRTAIREAIHDAIMKAYYDAVEASRRPGYEPRWTSGHEPTWVAGVRVEANGHANPREVAI